MKCDFCSEELGAGQREYKADDFLHKEVKGVQLMSGGSWEACLVCSMMVDAELWDELVERSTKTFFLNNPEFVGVVPYASVMEQVQELHGQFRKARRYAKT